MKNILNINKKTIFITIIISIIPSIYFSIYQKEKKARRNTENNRKASYKKEIEKFNNRLQKAIKNTPQSTSITEKEERLETCQFQTNIFTADPYVNENKNPFEIKIEDLIKQIEEWQDENNEIVVDNMFYGKVGFCKLENSKIKVLKFRKNPETQEVQNEPIRDFEQNQYNEIQLNSLDWLAVNTFKNITDTKKYLKEELNYDIEDDQFLKKITIYILGWDVEDIDTSAGYSKKEGSLIFLTALDPSDKFHAAIDVNVILHEFAHLLSYSLNPEVFFDNEEKNKEIGAISEGFSDYWGAAYTYSQHQDYYDNNLRDKNNMTIHPLSVSSLSVNPANLRNNTKIYVQRRLDKTYLQYDPSNDYSAHQTLTQKIKGKQVEYKSEEIWATALMTAFKNLFREGVSKKHVDKVIMEGMKKLKIPATMPQLAQLILQAARIQDEKNLNSNEYITSIHSAFYESFKNHNLLNHQYNQ